MRFRPYTRTGDDGESFSPLLGRRAPKDHHSFELAGALDEATSAIGLARALLPKELGDVDSELSRIQRLLFAAVTNLETRGRGGHISEDDVRWLEEVSDSRMEDVELFVIPSGHPAAAALHLARALTRRLERQAVRSMREEGLSAGVALQVLNRASSALFALAVHVNRRLGYREEAFRPRRSSSFSARESSSSPTLHVRSAQLTASSGTRRQALE